MPNKILVIDDDDDVRKVLKILLKQPGYEILEASGAEEAFQLLREHGREIETTLCDLKISNSNGMRVLEQIKRDYVNLPVIVVTGLVDLHVAVEVMKKGAFDFLTKPVKKDDLIFAIEKAINHKKFLDNFEELQQESRRYRKELEKVIIEKAKELESAYFHLNKIQIDLLNLVDTT